jgi:oligopeptide transport system substrate-binding protein
VTLNLAWSAAGVKNTGWGSDDPEPDNDLLPYVSSGLFGTRLHYNSATFHNFMTTAHATLDESARNAAFHSADSQLVLTDAAVLPIYYYTTQILKKSAVAGLHLTGLGYQAIPLKYVRLVSSQVYLPLLQR